MTNQSWRSLLQIQNAYEVLSDPAQRAMYDYEQTHYTKARRNASGIGRPWEKKRRPWENFDVHDWQSGAEKVSAVIVTILL